MTNAPSRLSLVSSGDDPDTVDTPEIQSLYERWQDAEKQLTALQTLEMEHIDAQPQSLSPRISSGDLSAQLAIIERIHTKLLSKIANARAENSEDLVSKLEIWKQIAISSGSEVAQPADLLVCSVLSDILSGALNSEAA